MGKRLTIGVSGASGAPLAGPTQKRAYSEEDYETYRIDL